MINFSKYCSIWGVWMGDLNAVWYAHNASSNLLLQSLRLGWTVFSKIWLISLLDTSTWQLHIFTPITKMRTLIANNSFMNSKHVENMGSKIIYNYTKIISSGDFNFHLLKNIITYKKNVHKTKRTWKRIIKSIPKI